MPDIWTNTRNKEPDPPTWMRITGAVLLGYMLVKFFLG